VGNREAFAGVLLDQKERDTLSVHFLDFRKDEINNQWCQSKGRFIKKDQPGMENEDPTQRQYLALTS